MTRMVEKGVRLIVNGQIERVPSPANLSLLLARRQPRPPFAVELNKRLVRRGEYESTPLAEGDRVEIVTLVGGG
jgi:sulfur carrier protein